MWTSRSAAVLSTIILSAFASGPVAAASDFPSKPIQIIMPYGAGGATDIITRVIADGLSKRIGTAAVVINKPGASGLIGSNFVKNATPDGYTILFHAVSIAIDQAVKKDTGFDVRRDLIPITDSVRGIAGVFVKKDLPVNSIKELVDLAKSRQTPLLFGSSGVGSPSHVVTEAFSTATGIKMVHVPSARGINDSVAGLISGQIDFLVNDITQELPLLATGQIKILAVTSKERSPDAPDVPTLAESAATGLPGLNNFRYDIWYGYFAPANTPDEIIQRLNKEIVGTLNDQDTRDRLLKIGYRDYQISGVKQDVFKSFVESEVARWEKTVRDAGIAPQ